MTNTTKPILLNIFFILIFSMISYAMTCSDTDGGLNRLVGGRVTWDVYGDISYYDDCCNLAPDYHLIEYYCSGSTAYSTTDDCADVYGDGSYCYGSNCADCPDGLCPTKAKCIIGCTDNDIGENQYITKSNVSYNSNFYYDSCQDKTRLNEYNCSGSPEIPHINQINCSTTYGGWWWNCSQGKCNEGESCSDSDYGKDYFNKGILFDMNTSYTDYCLYPYINGSNNLVEFFCNSTTGMMDGVEKDCSSYGEGWSCFNGECNIQSCLDVDGENYFSEGYVIYGAGNNTETFTDYCDEEETNLLYEFICTDEQNLDAIVKYCTDFGDNYKCENGRCIETSAPSEECPYPILFCDKFNYMSGISINGWRVYNSANNIKQLAPENNMLQFHDFDYTALSYSLNPFNIQFFKNGYWYYIMDTPYSPVMTVQFDVSIPNISFLYSEEFENMSEEVDENFYMNFPCLSLKSMTVNNNYLYWFLLCGNISDSGEQKGTLLYVNSSLMGLPSFNYIFGIDALPLDKEFNFKITWYFKNRDYYNEFQSNIPEDFYKIWIDEKPLYVNYYTQEGGNMTSDIILYQIEDNLGKEKDSLKKVILEKLYNFRGTIDNFYIITGDDIHYDTTMDYFGNVSMEFYEEGNISTRPTAKPKDFAEEVGKIWSIFGLRSTASKILFGLLLLCMIGVVLIAMFITTHNPVNFPAIAFIEILFMVLFVYLKLLPMWIPVILGIIAVGIIVWLVKTHFTGGGS